MGHMYSKEAHVFSVLNKINKKKNDLIIFKQNRYFTL